MEVTEHGELELVFFCCLRHVAAVGLERIDWKSSVQARQVNGFEQKFCRTGRGREEDKRSAMRLHTREIPTA